ncbi:MAG TPA: DUF3574 domain-containing protein [Pyrinomonadaceae bacterium]|nr:DUF3574 domain-containing protein [Pyrinomonadaceae bacterium]
MLRQKKLIIIWFLFFNFLFANQTAFAEFSRLQISQNFLADKFFRTELYFGTDKADGGKVTSEDWDRFLETEVTPRFPDGFTVLEGYGQFKDESGKIVREASKVLVLFYPKKMREAVNPKIEELRANYKKQFNQESVLRLDFTKSVEVSF